MVDWESSVPSCYVLSSRDAYCSPAAAQTPVAIPDLRSASPVHSPAVTKSIWKYSAGPSANRNHAVQRLCSVSTQSERYASQTQVSAATSGDARDANSSSPAAANLRNVVRIDGAASERLSELTSARVKYQRMRDKVAADVAGSSS